MANYCSNCGTPLPAQGDCVQCGNRAHNIEEHRASGLCEYSENGQQCPAPGTLSKALNGNGKWFCALHYQNLDNPRLCSEILRDYTKNGVPIYTDWRDKLIEDRLHGNHSEPISQAS